MDGILLHPSDSRAYSLSEPGFPIRSRCLLGEPDVDEFPALGISTTTASNSPCVGPLMMLPGNAASERVACLKAVMLGDTGTADEEKADHNRTGNSPPRLRE